MEASASAPTSIAGDGKLSLESSPSVGGVERPNTVARNVRARLGRKGIDFGTSLDIMKLSDSH
jgi:hypothetical protein